MLQSVNNKKKSSSDMLDDDQGKSAALSPQTIQKKSCCF